MNLGIEKAWDYFKNKKTKDEPDRIPAPILNNYGTIINHGGTVLGVPPSVLDNAIKDTFPKKRIRSLIKSTLEFIEPAKLEAGTWITGAGVHINPETIASAPSALDIALDDDDDESQEGYYQKEVIIHATDIDYPSSGWAGHIPGIWEKRIRMKLSPSIEPASLFAKDKIVADVILVSKRKADGNYTPYLLHVINVHA